MDVIGCDSEIPLKLYSRVLKRSTLQLIDVPHLFSLKKCCIPSSEWETVQGVGGFHTNPGERWSSLSRQRQKLKSAKPVVKTVRRWTNESKLELQACFDCTDWSVFDAATTDLHELTDTVTSYISFCEEMCVPTKTFLTYNNKPWFSQKLRQLRQAKEEAYRSGDRILYSQARNTLTKEIRVAKRSSKQTSVSVEEPGEDYQLQETPPHCREPSPS
ncbi:hypothetical protein L3Q82_004248 [Scortum barcoo]|uniref:Uncharacterized protein n=1 Tax=Scortum barcoo TaxID=214431 RepID=A0ACB8VJR4_9TELE|nr:hypothetical protein L3Q82_004248 [Scortum barcoo]